MTDEQLRAVARRVLGLVSEVVLDGRPCYVGYRDSLSFTRPIEEVDDAAVAILREEMAKARALTRTYPMPTGSPEFQELMRKHMEQQSKDDPFYGIPFNAADDPTQSFVATT